MRWAEEVVRRNIEDARDPSAGPAPSRGRYSEEGRCAWHGRRLISSSRGEIAGVARPLKRPRRRDHLICGCQGEITGHSRRYSNSSVVRFAAGGRNDAALRALAVICGESRHNGGFDPRVGGK